MATLNRPLGLAMHRGWEDIAAIILGALIVASPFVAGYEGMTTMLATTVIAGALVIIVGGMELVQQRRWEETIALICGLWILVSPFVLGYTGNLRTWHVVLGLLVAILAMFELWQSREDRV